MNATSDGPLALTLLFPARRADRAALRQWVGEHGAPEPTWADDAGLEDLLSSLPDDVVITPVSVGAPRTPGTSPAGAAKPRRRSGPTVLVGAPASVGDLRQRYHHRGAGGFAGFVRRQGTLALDRAERSVIGDRYKIPRLVAEDIIESAQFERRVQELAGRTGRTPDDVRAEAVDDLEEMTAGQSRLAIDAWTRLGRWMARAYRLDVDAEGLGALRELNRRTSLVFLPNHRSYLDPLVLRSALERAGFPPNHVLGGINLAFWPLGTIARRSSIVFIRRQFRDAPVYRAMLGEYLAYLVRKRFNLEWYIEGGRTRTGKLRPPRMGILSYLVDAFAAGGVDDVLLVPVSIVYDQQHEVGAISMEELGGTKAPESIAWAVDFARAQSRGRGRVHVRFAEPLSLRKALAEAAAEPDGSAAGTGEQTSAARARLAVPKVAFEVCHRINQVTPITASALVTFSLLDNGGRALTEVEMRDVLDPVLRYVRRRRLPMTSDVDLPESGMPREALATLLREGVITTFDGGTEPVYSIPDDRQHEAAFYRNTLVHFFVTRAIVELAVVTAAEQAAAAGNPAGDPTPAIWAESLRLRDVLKYEFFFPRKRDFDDEVRTEAAIAYPAWEVSPPRPDQLLPMMATTRLHVAPRVLGPFLEAYAVVADQLAAREPQRPVTTDEFVRECTGVARERWLRRTLHSPESISRDLFLGALRLAGNRDLVDPGREELRQRRQAFAAELGDAVRRVGVIRDLSSEGW